MAQVKIEDIVDHLSGEFTGAIEDTLSELLPDAEVDARGFFRTFKAKVYRRCSVWENVPGQYVKCD
jgi:hypothetical protein